MHNKKYIGAHVSIAGGIEKAIFRAQDIGANSFALFLKNQHIWQAKEIKNEEIIQFKTNCSLANISPFAILPHTGFLINLGSPKKEVYDRSIKSLWLEMKRSILLALPMLNIHIGSHLGLISEEATLEKISIALNNLLKRDNRITLVLENSAGSGGCVGYKFKHLADLIHNCDFKEQIGICIDTCHLFAAGYEIRTKSSYEKMWQEFENLIGLKYLKGLHLNDSKSDLGSRVDRHASLGQGKIGIKTFKYLIRDSRTNNIPLILETPDSSLWKEEIDILRKFSH